MISKQRSRPRAALWSAPFAIAAFAFAGHARAAAPTCPVLDVDASPEVLARWPAIEDDVRDAFAARDDVDRCAHVTIVAQRSDALVEVTLPDGRFASRAIARRDDVVPALEALLLVPAGAVEAQVASKAANETPPPPRSETPAIRVSIASVEVARDATSSVAGSNRQRGNHLRLEVSALAGARFGDGQAGVGVGAQSFLDAASWLIGFGLRADGYRALSSPSSAGVLEIALLGGRRVWLDRSTTLDVTFGPAAMIQGTSTYESHTPGRDVSASSSGMLPRFLLGTRVTFGARSLLRSFVEIDGELGPSRSPDDVPNAPVLPIWTLGLALGATVGTP